jgi:WD40 repeat protein
MTVLRPAPFARAIAIAVVLATGFFAAGATVQDARSYEEQAVKAFTAKDYPAFLSAVQKAAELRPNHPRLLTNLARAFALNGNRTEALKTLKLLTQMGLAAPIAKDESLASLRDAPEFDEIAAAFEANTRPIGTTSVAFNLKQKGLIPEGLAYDPASRTFFVGSVHQRKILRIAEDRAVSDFAPASKDLWSVLGLKVDSERHVLWAASAAMPQTENLDPADDGKSALLKFDLATGKLIQKVVLPKTDNDKHVLGDLTLNSRGDVFASDSLTPALYRLAAGSERIESFVTDARFTSPQGLCFSPDEKQLFMADYSQGIFVIDPASKKVSLLAPDKGITLLGIDGLYFYRGDLIGVQNGIEPQRIVRLSLNPELSMVTKCAVVAANTPSLTEPTLAVIVEPSIYVNGNSQWSAFGDDGKLLPDSKLEDAQVVKAQLR